MVEPMDEESEGTRADHDLCRLVLAGDEGAFAEIFERHRGPVFRASRAILREREAALDAMQETFVKVHRRLASWNGRAALGTWIVRIAIRTAVDHARREMRRGEEPLSSRPQGTDPRPALEDALLAARARELATRINGRAGTVLRLRLLGGYTNGEVAGLLGVSEANVRVQLSKAVRGLREMLRG